MPTNDEVTTHHQAAAEKLLDLTRSGWPRTRALDSHAGDLSRAWRGMAAVSSLGWT
jgi:hypothetical protein